MATDQLTIYDLQSREDAKVDVRQLPRLARYGVTLTLAAGRRELIYSTVLQVVAAAALGLTLLVGQQALQALLQAEDAAGGFITSFRGRDVARATLTGGTLQRDEGRRPDQLVHLAGWAGGDRADARADRARCR